MKSLVADMVNDDPKQRPTMDEVVTRFDDITKGLTLSSWKLGSRLGKKKRRSAGWCSSFCNSLDEADQTDCYTTSTNTDSQKMISPTVGFRLYPLLQCLGTP
jgi:hypothetical protein